MESTITGTVGDVTGRETSKGVIHDIVIGTQKVSAWSDSGLGEQAKALQGSTVEAVVDVVQRESNGRTFKNHNLKSLQLIDATGTSGTNVVTTTIPVAASDDAAPRIARSVAFEHMHQYTDVSALTESQIESALDTYAKWIYSGKWQGAEPVAVGAEQPAESDDGIPW